MESLCNFFGLDIHDTISEFRAFKASGRLSEENVALLTLQRTLETIPVSTADCERSISCMNLTVTKLRSTIETANVSSLMFISIAGPPTDMFHPSSYVKSWLSAGNHSSTDTNALGRRKSEPEFVVHEKIWDTLNG